MIDTLTLNPAIDYVMETDELALGGTNRARTAQIHFGGKGINVSTVLKELGLPTTALGFIAGFTGEALERSVRERGVATDFVRLPAGHTRINLKLQTGVETELNAPGPAVTDEDMERLFDKLKGLQPGDALILSGSVPPGLPATVYGDILARLEGRGIRTVVDAAGELLTHALKHRPFLIKPNRSELEGLAGQCLDSDEKLVSAAQALQAQGAQNVLVSLGPDGALLLDDQGQVHRRAALTGKAVNTVGAGDAMVAGFFAGLEGGIDHALTLSIAAGCAAAFSPGLPTQTDILALLGREP